MEVMEVSVRFNHPFKTLSILSKYFFIDGWVCTNDAWLGPRPVPYIYIWYKASKVGEVSVV